MMSTAHGNSKRSDRIARLPGSIRWVMVVCVGAGWLSFAQGQEAGAERDSGNRGGASAGDGGDPPTGLSVDGEALSSAEIKTIMTNTETNEDPDAKRRAAREVEVTDETEADTRQFNLDFYGSARLHAIHAIESDSDSGVSKTQFGDGASRVGVTADWRLRNGWNIYGRAEGGFDILDTFTTKAQNDSGGLFTPRLHNLTLETDFFVAKLGKSWSAYYKVAGAADRFSIFGGNAVGIYNAGTDGGATGTGRADDAIQTEVYVDIQGWTGIKPFNINVQFQQDQPIPGVDGEIYTSALSLSSWFETERELGVGVAYHRANVSDLPGSPALRRAGITGDASALAVAFKTYGPHWLASLVLARLENLETTDEGLYFDGEGAELFAQWQFHDRWWLTGGGNWLKPDDDQILAAAYRINYTVLGLRYSLDSFNRMFYVEWRNSNGRFASGQKRKNEVTIGLRWDFGY